MKTKNTLLEIHPCYTNKTKFDLKQTKTRGGKRSANFQLVSIESQIISEAMESGILVNKSLYLVNEHLVEEGQELLALSAVISVIKRLDTILTQVKKRKQGCRNPDTPWSRARFLMTQFMVGMVLMDMKKEVNGPVEKRWD